MAGFYKNDRGTLLEALNKVVSPAFILDISKKDEYELPVDGWFYFDSREEALAEFGIKELTPEERDAKVREEAEAARKASFKEFSFGS